jgi:tetratricopeptide (TPR) repeat protein
MTAEPTWRLKRRVGAVRVVASSVAVVLCAFSMSSCSSPRVDEQPRRDSTPSLSANPETNLGSETRASHASQRLPTNHTAAASRVLMLGTFPHTQLVHPAAEIEGVARSERGETAKLSDLRGQLPAPRVRSPLGAEAERLLSEAASALAASEHARALAFAGDAAKLAPSRTEPLELALLCHLAQGSPDAVRSTIAAIGAIEPSSPIWLVFTGLEAARREDHAEVLRSFGWLVGEGAVPRRGAAIPVPTRAGELEELCAISALRLRHPGAALEALDALGTDVTGDAQLMERAVVLRADALVALGRKDDAIETLGTFLARSTEGVEGAEPSRSPSKPPSQSIFAGAQTFDANEREAIRALAALRLDWLLEVNDVRGSTTREARATVSQSLHGIRSQGKERTITTLAAAAERDVRHDADQLEFVTRRLLASGLETLAVFEVIDRIADASISDAVRSRVLSHFGFFEEAFALADRARSRDRASSPALAAAALAAAELEDEVLFAEVADDARALTRGIPRTLATSARMLGDLRRARFYDVRAVGDATAAADLDAPAMRRLIMFRNETDTPDLALSLVQAARRLDESRHPLALEALALAEEIEPGLGVDELLTGRVRAPDVLDWAVELVRDAPAVPERRRLVIMLTSSEQGGRGDVVAGDASRDVLRDARPSELAQRFDALARAENLTRARDEVARTALRPKTPAAVLARGNAALRAGDVQLALASIEALASSTGGTMSPRIFRGALALAESLADAHAFTTTALRAALPNLLVRVSRCDLEEMEAALRLSILLEIPPLEGEQLASLLARVVRVPEEPTDEIGVDGGDPPFDRDIRAMYARLVARNDDPILVAQLADALARESRLSPAQRALHGAAAVALYAVSGGGVEKSIAVVDRLRGDGIALFARADEAVPSAAESIFRASSAYAMAGDEIGSEQLLREVIRRDPSIAGALNNLAYVRLSAGTFDAEVVALAERAATISPANPAVLDTLGWVRYHSGRIRDDGRGPGAITLFRQALRIDPDDPSLATLDQLGDALWRDGDQAGAVKCWQQVSQVAVLRYPPEQIARRVREFQRREFGVEVVDPLEYVRRQYLRVVERAEAKLVDVARGRPPALPECLGVR